MTQKTLTYEEFENFLQDLNDKGMIIYPISVEQTDSEGNTVVTLEVTQSHNVTFNYDFSILKALPEIKMEIKKPPHSFSISFEQEVPQAFVASVHTSLTQWRDTIQSECEHVPMTVGDYLYCAKCSMNLV